MRQTQTTTMQSNKYFLYWPSHQTPDYTIIISTHRISIHRVGLSMITMSNKLEIIHVLRFIFYVLVSLVWCAGLCCTGRQFFLSIRQLIDQITAKYLQYPPAHWDYTPLFKIKLFPNDSFFKNIIKGKWSVLLHIIDKIAIVSQLQKNKK